MTNSGIKNNILVTKYEELISEIGFV